MSYVACMYAAGGASRNRYHKPSKMEIFRCQFTAVIVLDNPTLTPFGKISGQLAVDLGWPIKHYGIRVQLEAQCSLKFETKLDNRVSFHKKYDNILPGAGEIDMSDTFQESPIMTDVVRILGPDEDPYELQPGNHRYRFTFPMSGDELPAPFKTSYGTLTYKLVAYMVSGLYVQVGEKTVRFQGYFNLSKNVDAVKPIHVERSAKKSIFSSKKMLTATLHVDSSGFLPSESVPFTLAIDNKKCLPLKMWISVNQRSIFNIDGAKKATVAVLASAVHQTDEANSQYAWVGTLNIHKASAPSYTGHSMHTVTHSLQFKVKFDDYNIIKGDVPIYIGTTIEPEEVLKLSANLLCVATDRFPTRRGSWSSTHSDSSGLSVFTLPPSYSTLSSRMPSLETLPPPYDFDNEFKAHSGQRRSSCLEFRVIPPDESSQTPSPQPGAVTPASSGNEDDGN